MTDPDPDPEIDIDIDDTAFTGTLPGFLDWVDETLVHGAIAISEPVPHVRAGSDAPGRMVRRVEMVSAGHSDDEELLHRIFLGPLQVHWVSSHAGGLYVYEVPVDRFDRVAEQPWLLPRTGLIETIARARTLVVHGATGLALEIDLPHGVEIFFEEPDRDIAAPAGVLTITANITGPLETLKEQR